MNDQIRISDSGELETVPTTWDGEPLYSTSTVAEGLFDADAFKQMKGQIAMEEEEEEEEPFPYELWRYAHVVGRDSTKYHLIPRDADETLCGLPKRSLNCRLAEGYEQQVMTSACRRCVRRAELER